MYDAYEPAETSRSSNSFKLCRSEPDEIVTQAVSQDRIGRHLVG